MLLWARAAKLDGGWGQEYLPMTCYLDACWRRLHCDIEGISRISFHRFHCVLFQPLSLACLFSTDYS